MLDNLKNLSIFFDLMSCQVSFLVSAIQQAIRRHPQLGLRNCLNSLEKSLLSSANVQRLESDRALNDQPKPREKPS